MAEEDLPRDGEEHSGSGGCQKGRGAFLPLLATSALTPFAMNLMQPILGGILGGGR